MYYHSDGLGCLWEWNSSKLPVYWCRSIKAALSVGFHFLLVKCVLKCGVDHQLGDLLRRLWSTNVSMAIKWRESKDVHFRFILWVPEHRFRNLTKAYVKKKQKKTGNKTTPNKDYSQVTKNTKFSGTCRKTHILPQKILTRPYKL